MLLNGMYGYGEFLGGSNEWKNEMAELLMVLSPRGTTLDDINQAYKNICEGITTLCVLEGD